MMSRPLERPWRAAAKCAAAVSDRLPVYGMGLRGRRTARIRFSTARGGCPAVAYGARSCGLAESLRRPSSGASRHLVTATSAMTSLFREECPAPGGHPGQEGRSSDRHHLSLLGWGEAGSRPAASSDPDRLPELLVRLQGRVDEGEQN